jgi:hypothetical protein
MGHRSFLYCAHYLGQVRSFRLTVFELQIMTVQENELLGMTNDTLMTELFENQ